MSLSSGSILEASLQPSDVYLKTSSIDLRTFANPCVTALPAFLLCRPAPVANSLVFSFNFSAVCWTPVVTSGMNLASIESDQYKWSLTFSSSILRLLGHFTRGMLCWFDRTLGSYVLRNSRSSIANSLEHHLPSETVLPTWAAFSLTLSVASLATCLAFFAAKTRLQLLQNDRKRSKPFSVPSFTCWAPSPSLSLAVLPASTTLSFSCLGLFFSSSPTRKEFQWTVNDVEQTEETTPLLTFIRGILGSFGNVLSSLADIIGAFHDVKRTHQRSASHLRFCRAFSAVVFAPFTLSATEIQWRVHSDTPLRFLTIVLSRSQTLH